MFSHVFSYYVLLLRRLLGVYVQSIMPVFEPLRRRAHVCLVGSGDGHMRARGLGTKNGRGMGSQKAARDEYSYVNTCALFFIKRAFPYVSVLEGVSVWRG